MRATAQFPYAGYTMAALIRLLNHTPGASAIHRALLEEIARRGRAKAKATHDDPVLCTATEWSKQSKHEEES
jgi:hypothetical protein